MHRLPIKVNPIKHPLLTLKAAMHPCSFKQRYAELELRDYAEKNGYKIENFRRGTKETRMTIVQNK